MVAIHIFYSPAHCDLVESIPRDFQLLVKKQEVQHMHAKVLNLELAFPLQNPSQYHEYYEIEKFRTCLKGQIDYIYGKAKISKQYRANEAK